MSSMVNGKNLDEIAKRIDKLCEDIIQYKLAVENARTEDYGGVEEVLLTLYQEGQFKMKKILCLGKTIGVTQETQIYRSSLSMAQTTLTNTMGELEEDAPGYDLDLEKPTQ